MVLGHVRRAVGRRATSMGALPGGKGNDQVDKREYELAAGGLVDDGGAEVRVDYFSGA